MKRRLFVFAVALMTALVGAAAGWVAGGARSSGFVSTATVVINPLQGNAFWDESVSDIVTLQTEAQQARSDAVLETVAGTVEATTDIGVLRRRVSVSVATGSEVIRLSYKGASPVVTEAVAEELAKATLEERRQRALDTRVTQVENVKAALNQVQNELEAAQDPTTQSVLRQRSVVLEDQLDELGEQKLVAGALIGVTTEVASRKTLRIGIAVVGAFSGALFGLWLGRRLVRLHASRRPIV